MYVERIKFERTGGFAGIRLAANVEVNDLSEDQKQEILKLLDDMDFDELPEKISGKMPIPDEFVYSIIVVSDKREYQVFAGESALPVEARPLIEILERIAKRQMRNKS